MIHLTDSGHAAGTIVVAAAIQPRYYDFTLSLDELAAPVGTKLCIERSCDITQNFNNGIKKMVGDWVWFLGDDHSFAPDLLMRLLDFNVDIVVPITPCKVAPWMPCLMHGPDDPSHGWWQEDMPLYHWDELSGPGLLPLPKGDFIGQAGMLVRKSVLDTIGYPWFKCGQLDPGRLQEDMQFCHEVQQRGYTVYVDQETIFDHHFPQAVTARKVQGKWCPALKGGNGRVMVLPDAKPKFHHETQNTIGSGMKKTQWYTLPKTLDEVNAEVHSA
jgi:hypothetical protein